MKYKTVKTLLPNTTYYLRITCGSKAEYLLTIGAPEPAQDPNTIEPEEAPVFEVPFELNETQVRFIANKAEFLNPEAAKIPVLPSNSTGACPLIETFF